MKNLPLRLVVFTAGAMLWSMCAAAPPAARSPADQRMLRLAELWRDVKLYHPALATTRVDWDTAMANSLPALQAAQTTAELQAALTELVRPLGNAEVRTTRIQAAPYMARDAAAPLVDWLPGEVALVRLHHATSRNEDTALVAAQPEIVARARGVIVDLRPDGPVPVEERVVHQLVTRLIDSPVQLPVVRYRTHSGYRPQVGSTSGNYRSGFDTTESDLLLPARSTRAVPLVFIVNNRHSLPIVALALQRRGQAHIVAQDGLPVARLLPQQTVYIDKGVAVEFPRGELIYDDGTTGMRADASPPADQLAGSGSPAVSAALKLLGDRQRAAPPDYKRAAAIAVRAVEKPYPEMRLPNLAWRQLAAIKLWAVADAFFPYKEGMAQPWDDGLLHALRQMEQAGSELDYTLALQRMAATLQDSHVFLNSPVLSKYLGTTPPGVRLARVEGRIAVVRLDADSEAARAGLRAGDVVLSIDGEDAEQRTRRIADLLGGSTSAGRDRNGLRSVLGGDEEKQLALQVERGDGQIRSVSLARRKAASPPPPPSAAPYRLLDARIGYADLDLLLPEQVDAMFSALGQTDSLILDMRGYPEKIIPLLTARLNVHGVRPATAFSRPVLSAREAMGVREVFVQTTLPARSAPYSGKVIMLLNEMTQSRAEHAAMFVEAATPVTFIGSPTAGANGDITNTVLPGNIQVWFTGQEVRHVDGKPLQRVGIQPHIPSAPTLAGLRAGRDDVLERAISFARNGK